MSSQHFRAVGGTTVVVILPLSPQPCPIMSCLGGISPISVIPIHVYHPPAADECWIANHPVLLLGYIMQVCRGGAPSRAYPSLTILTV